MMRLLALFLLLHSGLSADSVLAFYWNRLGGASENTLLDNSGNGQNMASSQTLTYNTTPKAEGNYSATGFTGCCTSDTGNGLNDSFSNSSITVQVFFRLTSLAAEKCLHSFSTAAGASPSGIRIQTTGQIDFYYFGSVTKSATGLVTTEQWYYLAYHVGADVNSCYLQAISSSSGFTAGSITTPILTATGGGGIAVGDGAIQVGRWAPAGTPVFANGYIDSLSYRKGDLPALPTYEMVTAANTLRNPYLRRVFSPKLGAFLPFFFFPVPDLHAITQDQVIESRQAKLLGDTYSAKIADIRFKDAVSSGKGSPTKTFTRTPTPKPNESATPSPTVTLTPNKTQQAQAGGK